MIDLFGGWHAVALLLVSGFLANGIWRAIGLWIGGGIREGSEFLIWVRAVASSILAAVIVQILLVPPGVLATVPIGIRFGAAAFGFAVYLIVRKSVLAGVIAGEIVIIAGKWWVS